MKTVGEIAGLSEVEANRVGVELWKKKKYHQAVKVFEFLLSKNPKSATTWFNLAVNENELGEKKKAREAYEKGISMDALNPNLLEFSESLLKSELNKSR